MTAAILILFSALTPAPAATATPAPLPAPARAIPAKAAAASRVWTNEDVQALESTAEISIVGQPEVVPPTAPAAAAPETQGAPAPAPVTASAPTAAQTSAASEAPYVKEQDPNWYAQGIETRRDRIDQIDGQIQEIQQIRATGVGISGAIPLDKTAPGITPEATIEVLQDRKNHLESDVHGMQDLAQSNSIERDAWR